MPRTLEPRLVAELRTEIEGTVLGPKDEGYDDARAVHNALIDRRPALIVRCATTHDVVSALAFANRVGLEVSIRGGGHDVAGHAVTDSGVMLDLREMNGISVDARRATAVVGAGTVWGEFNAAAAAHGLAVTGSIVATTGVAGLTLGGGSGWLTAKHGLTTDSLLSAEIVTAEGDVLRVDAGSHPDLYWALRGGGGNFGVVTSLTYRLHPVDVITGGLIVHPLHDARALLRFYRTAINRASDDLSVFAALVHAPDGSGAKLAALIVFHTGAAATAARDLDAFTSWGKPLLVDVGPMPYPAMNTMLDWAFPARTLNYWRSRFTRGLPGALIDTAVDRFASTPSPLSTIVLEHFHGAATRIAPNSTALPHRLPGWNLLISSIWTEPASNEANIEWARETVARLQPHLRGDRWLNYLADDESPDAVAAAYGSNLERLREVKQRYDPHNVFHLNHNIVPHPRRPTWGSEPGAFDVTPRVRD